MVVLTHFTGICPGSTIAVEPRSRTPIKSVRACSSHHWPGAHAHADRYDPNPGGLGHPFRSTRPGRHHLLVVAAEPVFTELHSVVQLHGWWQRGESDAMIGALVRLAAADGGDDLDAATVLLHLLEPGARNLARRLARHRDDALGVVLGELACQIRIYPWRRRSRRFAAGLLLDTQHVLWRGELRPGREVLYDPLSPPVATEQPIADKEPELIDILTWAAAAGIATAADVELLSSIFHAAPGTQALVAAKRDIHVKTLRRRRDLTITALRSAADAFLAVA